jgi:protease-4
MHHDSLVFRTLRAFLSGFALLFGVFVAIGLGLFLIGAMNKPDLIPQPSSVKIAQDAHGSRDLLPDSAPVILRIDLHGVIGDTYLTSTDIENVLLDSQIVPMANGRVKGILLNINTPGGTTTDTAAIYTLLEQYKVKYNVPVYAFVDGLCASGGMYIASACDKILASPWSVIGSVGVLSQPYFNVSKAMEDFGIKAIVLNAGKDKDALSPFRPWGPDESHNLLAVMNALYDQFVYVVTKSRPQLDRDQLINKYGAHVFIAQTAMEYGYIDSASATYGDALQNLALAAGLDPNAPYQVLQLSPPHNPFLDLIRDKSALFDGKITHRIQLHPLIPDALCDRPLYLYLPNH